MKKHITILAVLALTLTASNAISQISFNRGIKAGFQSANLDLDPASVFDFAATTGIVAGGFLEVDLLGPLGFQGEALYSQKGAGFDTDVASVDLRLNYLEIPVIAKFDIFAIPMFTLNVQGGMYWATKLGESVDPSEINPFEEDFFKDADNGFTFGAGLKFKAILTNLLVDARYSMGTADISKDEAEAKNRSFMVTAGITF